MSRIASGVVVGVLIAAALAVVTVGPYVRDDFVLDRVVRVVALDWRDFGEDAARSRLQYELDHHNVGMQVEDGDCELGDDRSGRRRVACSWMVHFTVPGAKVSVPLAFRSEAEITPDGDLR